jgi:hypothetical protein
MHKIVRLGTCSEADILMTEEVGGWVVGKWKVDGIGPGSYPVAGCCIGGVELVGYINGEFVD